MKLKQLIRPSGAHQELRACGFWNLAGGLCFMGAAIVVTRLGGDSTVLQVIAGALIVFGLFGLFA